MSEEKVAVKDIGLREAYITTIEDIFNSAIEIVRKKSQDYATEGDPFRNFRDSALFAGVTVEQGIMVRLSDKYSRVRNLLEKNPGASAEEGGAVGESLQDTLKDAVNYTAILLTWLILDHPAPSSSFQVEADEAVPVNPADNPELHLSQRKIPDYLQKLIDKVK